MSNDGDKERQRQIDADRQAQIQALSDEVSAVDCNIAKLSECCSELEAQLADLVKSQQEQEDKQDKAKEEEEGAGGDDPLLAMLKAELADLKEALRAREAMRDEAAAALRRLKGEGDEAMPDS